MTRNGIVFLLLLAAFVWIEIRSADPLMPMRLFRNRSLVAGMSITFIYMGSFGALPYFLTVLFQTVMGFTALQTGLAFILPSLAIAGDRVDVGGTAGPTPAMMTDRARRAG